MGRPKTPIKFGIFGSGHHSHSGQQHDSASSASAAASRASSVHSGHQPSVYAAFVHPSAPAPATPGPAPALSVKTAPPALTSVKGVPQGWNDDLSVALPVPVVLPPTPVPGQFPPAAPSVAVYAGGKAKGSAVNPGAAWAAWEREHLASARSEAEVAASASTKRRGASSTLASLTPRPTPSKHVSDGAVDPERRHHDNLFGSLSRRASRMASLRVPRTALGSEGTPDDVVDVVKGSSKTDQQVAQAHASSSTVALSSWKSVRRSVADASSAVSQYYHTHSHSNHSPHASHSYSVLTGGGSVAALPPSPCPSSPGVAARPLPPVSATTTPVRAPSPLPPTPRSPPHSPRMALVVLPATPPAFGSIGSSGKSVKGLRRPHTTGSTGHTWSSSGALASAGFAAPFGMISTAPTESEASVATSATDFSNLFTKAREGSTRTSQSVHHYRPSDISLDCATPTTEAFSSWETSAPVCDSPAVLSAEGSAAMPLLGPATQEGWYEPPTPRGAGGVRRIWRGADGREVRAIYKVGYERAVLDLEARLHETMYEVANGRHSFVDADEPGFVLDVSGTRLKQS